MFETWLDLSVGGIFATLAVILAVGAFASIALLAVTKLQTQRVQVVAPFFSTVSVLFALLTGFAANDAWERQRAAGRAILAERDAILAIHELSVATVSDMSAIRDALRHYLDMVVSDEWPLMREARSSAKAEAELAKLLAQLASPQITQEAGATAHQALVQLWQRVHSARTDRLALGEQVTDEQKWLTIMVLTLLTQLSIAVVHLGNPRSQALALLIFSLAALSTLGLIAVKERPFDGPLAVAPAALQKLSLRLAQAP